jgi:hypothetical protein
MTAAAHVLEVDGTDVGARLEALDKLLVLLDGRADDAVLRSARGVSRRVSERLRLSPAHTVVALAGATGSG